jgi:hypothetical protein
MEFQEFGTSLCESAGKLIINDMKKKGINFKEALRYKEDITLTTGAALYVTALASVIREAVEPNLQALETLQLNTDLMYGGGKGAIKLPKEQRVTAAEVAEGGAVTYTGTGYTSITVTPTKKVAASKITWEMIKRGMVSMVVSEANRIGKALARKVDSDILTGETAVITAANGNRIATGGATTRVSYNNLIDARALLEAQDFQATHLYLHPTDYAALCKDTDFQEALYRGTVNVSSGNDSAKIFPRIEYFGAQKIVITSQITSGTSMFIDANEAGTFVKETDVEIVDGRLPGYLDTEVIGVISYGIGIQNVSAISGVIMAAS